MKVKINHPLKIKLLTAIKEGVFDIGAFPELANVIIEWHKGKTPSFDPIAESPLNELSIETLRAIEELIHNDKAMREAGQTDNH